MKPITEREEFESNCVYVIWYHDYYNLEDHVQKCVCLTDREYQQKHSAIVEMYSECGRIETHIYAKHSAIVEMYSECGRIETHIYAKECEIRTRSYQNFESDRPIYKEEIDNEN